MYPSPEHFIPERFLKPDSGGLNPDAPFPAAAFGFGRRVCPGQHLAYESLWIAAACVLAAYNISPEMDERGEPVLPSTDPDFGFSSYVLLRLGVGLVERR